ncbi:MAG: TIGR03986 family CRISPR-associated RAMP protein [Fimbriimonadaceae bacterium]|nr:TIGR03986 family CRISPR-associated RAMP protein [Fimbriimonadaceae bacterium]
MAEGLWSDRPIEPGERRRATAPYNFVPLPAQVVAAASTRTCGEAEQAALAGHDDYQPARHSGWFEVDLETLTPLYIRGTYRRGDFETLDSNPQAHCDQVALQNDPVRGALRNQPDFFHRGDPSQPVIPGSSLRGMLRQIVEIAGHGRLDRVSAKRMFYRALDESPVGEDFLAKFVTNGTRHGDPSARIESRAGILCRHGDGWRVELCGLLRVEKAALAAYWELLDATNLYTNTGPAGIPQAAYQHKMVGLTGVAASRWHMHPANGRHPDIWLRYAKAEGVVEPVDPAAETTGLVVLTGPMQQRGQLINHLAFVFEVFEEKEYLELEPIQPAEGEAPITLVDLLNDKDQVTQWQGRAFGAGGRLGDGQPVFFLSRCGPDGVERVWAFGRAQLFRLPYEHAPVDLVPPQLREPAVVDYADALFGLTPRGPAGGRKLRGCAGRVQVTDAELAPDQGDPYVAADLQQAFIPGVLGGPKPSSFQHYLHQQSDRKDALRHYDRGLAETTLRGHKLYWHRPPEQGTDDATAHDHASQYTAMQRVRDRVHFRFRVYFDNLSDAELGALAWALQPVGLEGLQYCHKLGMGKPRGLGSVRLTATLHRVDRRQRYGGLFDHNGWQQGTLPPEQLSGSPADEQRLLDLTAPFEQHILGELGYGDTLENLYELPRIAALLALLDYDRRPAQDTTASQALGSFRDRRVLPWPLDAVFGQTAADHNPDVLPSAAGVQAGPPPEVPPPAAPPDRPASPAGASATDPPPRSTPRPPVPPPVPAAPEPPGRPALQCGRQTAEVVRVKGRTVTVRVAGQRVDCQAGYGAEYQVGAVVEVKIGRVRDDKPDRVDLV